LPIDLGQRHQRLTNGRCGRLSGVNGTDSLSQFGSQSVGQRLLRSLAAPCLRQQIARYAEQPWPGVVAGWDSIDLLPCDDKDLSEHVGGIFGVRRAPQEVDEEVRSGTTRSLVLKFGERSCCRV